MLEADRYPGPIQFPDLMNESERRDCVCGTTRRAGNRCSIPQNKHSNRLNKREIPMVDPIRQLPLSYSQRTCSSTLRLNKLQTTARFGAVPRLAWHL
jgi:hypothetical protein